MAYSLVTFIEKGQNTNGVVPTNWIQKDWVWSNGRNAVKESKTQVAIDNSWPSYMLVKVRLQMVSPAIMHLFYCGLP